MENREGGRLQVGTHDSVGRLDGHPHSAIETGFREGMQTMKKAVTDMVEADLITEEEAMKQIANSLRKFYSEKHPEVLKSQLQSLEKAIETVQNSYKNNMFPEMKVKWSEYPNNIGHLYFPGCTRCHDGNHVDKENHIISNKCNNCHTILSQGPNSSNTMATTADGLEFQHPVDIGDEWKSGQCSACHNGSVH